MLDIGSVMLYLLNLVSYVIEKWSLQKYYRNWEQLSDKYNPDLWKRKKCGIKEELNDYCCICFEEFD